MKDASVGAGRALTAKYAGIQGMYYSALVPVMAFASVFLLDRGFTNSQIGTLIALGNIGSAAMQLAIGQLAGRSRVFSIRAMVAALSAAVIALSLALCTMPLAPNMAGVYLVQCLNMFSFAMFIPASVYYVARIMDEADRVKGQAYLGSAIALSGICANFAGGRILDAYGPGAMLRCVVALSAIGNAIVIPVVRSMHGREDRRAGREVSG